MVQFPEKGYSVVHDVLVTHSLDVPWPDVCVSRALIALVGMLEWCLGSEVLLYPDVITFSHFAYSAFHLHGVF